MKAKQFANLTGVSIGHLVYIGETGGNIPGATSYGVKSMAMMAESVTPIREGEVTVTAICAGRILVYVKVYPTKF